MSHISLGVFLELSLEFQDDYSPILLMQNAVCIFIGALIFFFSLFCMSVLHFLFLNTTLQCSDFYFSC